MAYKSKYHKAKIHASKDLNSYYDDAKHKILGNGTHVIMDGALSPTKILRLDSRFGKWFTRFHDPGRAFQADGAHSNSILVLFAQPLFEDLTPLILKTLKGGKMYFCQTPHPN